MNVCPKGHYCNASGMTKPLQCGHSGVFCAEGSIEPQQVLKGYYTVGGAFDEREEQVIAPKGYYATEGILKECPGIKYYCPGHLYMVNRLRMNNYN